MSSTRVAPPRAATSWTRSSPACDEGTSPPRSPSPDAAAPRPRSVPLRTTDSRRAICWSSSGEGVPPSAASRCAAHVSRSSCRAAVNDGSDGGSTGGSLSAPARHRSAHRRTSQARPSARARRRPMRASSEPWAAAPARSSVAPIDARSSSTTARPRRSARLAPDRSSSATRSNAVACQAWARRAAGPRDRARAASARATRASSGRPRTRATRAWKVRTCSASTGQPWASSSTLMRRVRVSNDLDGGPSRSSAARTSACMPT